MIPSLSELLDAARLHFETAVVPAVRADRKLYFQTLVAINVLKIAERELHYGDAHARAAWARLNALLGEETPLPEQAIPAALDERNQALSQAIRAGAYDGSATLLAHLKATASEQLTIANPRFLRKLQDEDANPERDAWNT